MQISLWEKTLLPLKSFPRLGGDLQPKPWRLWREQSISVAKLVEQLAAVQEAAASGLHSGPSLRAAVSSKFAGWKLKPAQHYWHFFTRIGFPLVRLPALAHFVLRWASVHGKGYGEV